MRWYSGRRRRRTVNERIEIVGPRLRPSIGLPPQTTAFSRRVSIDSHSAIRDGCGRTRIARLAQRGMAACPYAPYPFENERRFGRAAVNQRRTDPEDERVPRVEADLCAELVTRP